MAQEFPEADMTKLLFVNFAARGLKNQLNAQKNEVQRLWPWTQSADITGLTGFQYKTDNLSAEYRNLSEISKVNYIPSIIGFFVDSIRVVGFTRKGEAIPQLWDAWNKHDMAQKSSSQMKAALEYGEGLLYTSIGVDGEPTKSVAVNPAKFSAFRTNFNDTLPSHVIEDLGNNLYKVYDNKYIYSLSIPDEEDRNVEFLNIQENGLNRMPFCSVVPNWDIVKETRQSEVDRAINTQKLIFKSIWDTLATSHSQGFKVRYITGVELPDEEFDENGNPVTQNAKNYLQQLRQDSLLVTPNKDAQIGTLPETPIDGLLKGVESAITHMATTMFVPLYVFNQGLSNIGLETANIANQSTVGKLNGLITRITAPIRYQASLLLAAEGLEVPQEEIEVQFAPVNTLLLSQFVDALGKTVALLGFPGEVLWSSLVKQGAITPQQLEQAYIVRDKKEAAQAQFDSQLFGTTPEPSSLPEPSVEV